MSFTDEDLKRLKEYAKDDFVPINFQPKMCSLLARLKAAEKSRQAWWDHVHDLRENIEERRKFPRICFTCKHYLAWHFNLPEGGGQCVYRADGKVCDCKEFKA